MIRVEIILESYRSESLGIVEIINLRHGDPEVGDYSVRWFEPKETVRGDTAYEVKAEARVMGHKRKDGYFPLVQAALAALAAEVPTYTDDTSLMLEFREPGKED